MTRASYYYTMIEMSGRDYKPIASTDYVEMLHAVCVETREIRCGRCECGGLVACPGCLHAFSGRTTWLYHLERPHVPSSWG